MVGILSALSATIFYILYQVMYFGLKGRYMILTWKVWEMLPPLPDANGFKIVLFVFAWVFLIKMLMAISVHFVAWRYFYILLALISVVIVIVTILENITLLGVLFIGAILLTTAGILFLLGKLVLKYDPALSKQYSKEGVNQ